MLPVAILAGGLATRLRPLTSMLPKSLLDVNGEPFVAHQLRLLKASDIERVVICAGYLGDMIRDAVGTGLRFGLQVDFSFDGPNLLGTAGAVKKALPLLGDAFFVLYGDSYLPCDYAAVQKTFQGSRKLALMTVFRNQNRLDRSNIKLLNGEIVAYDKRNRVAGMDHIDYGLGLFRNDAFRNVSDHEALDLAVLYQELLRRGEVVAYEVRERFYEIGSLTGLEETRRYIARYSQDPPEFSPSCD
jgi:N-acetyl-alpha-D-muramate 1-phosphate uridylyltransferase